jgi:hypothetical protein
MKHAKKRRVVVARVVLYVVAVVALILVGTQLERLKTQGTLLGYKVYTIDRTRPATQEELLRGAEERSVVCAELSEDYVSEQLGIEVSKSALLPDISEPDLYSSCLYRSEYPKGTLVVSVRKFSNNDKAGDYFDKVKKDLRSVSLDAIDSAVIGEKPRQIIAINSGKVITVTISDELYDGIKKEDVLEVISKDSFSKIAQ